MQTTGFRKWGVVFAFIVIVIILGAVATFLLTAQTGEEPSVTIIQPDAELVISAGQGLVVVAQVNASQPIERCVLLVDGEPALQQALQPGESGPVTVSFPWFSTKPGRHTLSVIAYDSNKRTSTPVQVQVTVLKAMTLADDLDENVSPPSDQNAANGQANDGVQTSPGNGEAAPPGGGGEPLQDDGLAQIPDEGPGGGDLQLGDQPLDEIDPPDALPPTISFGASWTRQGSEIEVYFTAQAAGDTFLDRIEFIRTRHNDGFTVTYIEDCDQSRVCFHDDTFNITIAQTWIITAQAFDIAGQASELKVEVIELLGDNPLGPAIVDAQFQDAPEVPREAELAGIGPIIGHGDAIALMIGDEEAPPEDPDYGEDLSDCLNLTVHPNVQGCSGDFCNVDISLDILCEITALPEENILLFLDRQYYPEFGFGVALDTSEWNSQSRSTMSAGSRYELQDTRHCGASALYSTTIAFGTNPDNRTMGKAEIVHEFPPCQQDAISANITLLVDENPNGSHVSYQFNPAGNWSSNLPADPVQLRMFLHTTHDWESNRVYEVSMPGINLPGASNMVSAGRSHLCSTPTYYTFLGTYNSNELFSVTTAGSGRPCPHDSLGNIPIELTVGNNMNNETFFTDYKFDLPAGVAWPEVDHFFVALIHEGESVRQESVGGVVVSSDIRQQGYTMEGRDYAGGQIRCGLNEYNYFLATTVNGYVVDKGPFYTITTPPCP